MTLNSPASVTAKDNMTVPAQENQAQEQKPNDKELNFRKQQEMYERKIEQERQARLQAEERAAKLEQQHSRSRDDDDDDDEPYVDKRKLDKKLSKFEEKLEQKIDQKAEQKAAAMIENERKVNYLRENADFNQIMSSDTVQKFAERHPKLAENILRMPEGFERQKLVFEAIKAMGMDKPEQKQPSIQEKIDANRKSPYYQPSGVGTAPYSSSGDYSPGGQKNAYDKMKELQARLRI